MKHVFLLVILFSGILNQSFAQKKGNDKIDSLFKVLKTAKEDTAKVNTLNVLAYEIARNNPDTAVYFGNEALTLAIKLHYKLGVADAHYTIGRGFYYLEKSDEALKKYNEALVLYDGLLPSSNKAFKFKILKGKSRAYNSIGIIYDGYGNWPEALKNYLTALRIYQDIGYSKGIAMTSNNIGSVFSNQGNYPEALKYFSAALKISEESGDKNSQVYNLYNIGITYNKQGNFAVALEKYFRALKLNQVKEDKIQEAEILSNIGAVYYEQSNYEAALKYSFEAIKIYGELHNKRNKAGTLTNIGSIYNDQGNYEEAIKYYSEALKINEESGNKQWEAYNLDNIGIVYSKQGDYLKALKNHFAALKLLERIGDKDGLGTCFYNIGGDYIKLNKYGMALHYLNKGLSIAIEIGSREIFRDSYKSLAELDSAQANFKGSLENYKIYITYRDSLRNKESTKKMMQAQMQYDFDKKESFAKAEQDKKDAIGLKEMQKERLVRNVLIGGFALLLILGAIISIIVNQRREIRLIKHERNRISRELHDDIGAELNRITMISQHLHQKTFEDKEMRELLVSISETGKKVLGSIGEIIWTMNPQKNNLASLFAYIRRYVTEYLEMNGIEVEIDFPGEIPVNSITDVYRRNVFLVIKEAIYNITKYSKATRVILSLKFLKKLAEVEISDNGVGFSVDEKQHWGNGLRNMDQRMKEIGGLFRIRSKHNQGTSISLNFPVR